MVLENDGPGPPSGGGLPPTGGPAMRPMRYHAALAGALLTLPFSVSALILAPPPTGGGPGPDTPPDCSNAAPSVSIIWPPNHKMVPVQINGVTDPNGLQVTVSI